MDFVIESFRKCRALLLRLLSISPDPKLDPEYLQAEDWKFNSGPPTEKDAEDKKEQFKQVHEYGQSTFNELIAAFDKASDRAQALLRLNAYLIAGVFAFFKTQSATIPILVKLGIFCWFMSMLILAIASRPLWRPSRADVSELQDFLTEGDDRLIPWLNTYTHLAIIELRVVINSEARIVNAALFAMGLGLVLLLIAVLSS